MNKTKNRKESKAGTNVHNETLASDTLQETSLVEETNNAVRKSNTKRERTKNAPKAVSKKKESKQSSEQNEKLDMNALLKKKQERNQ